MPHLLRGLSHTGGSLSLCLGAVILSLFFFSGCAIIPEPVRTDILGKAASTVTNASMSLMNEIYEWQDKEDLGLERIPISGGTVSIVREDVERNRERDWRARVWAPADEAQWNGRILWYFHSAFDQKADFVHGFSGKANYEIWENLGEKKPIVATLNLGSFWVADEILLPQVERCMLEVEKQIARQVPYFGKSPRRRWVLGLSMGGLTALQLHLFGNRELINYERIIAVAPLIPPVDPFIEEDERITNKLRRPDLAHAHRRGIMGSIRALKVYFSHEEWQERNPVVAAAQGRVSHQAKLLIVYGKEDQLGLNVTSQQLADLLGMQAVAHEGKHYMPLDRETQEIMADFLRNGQRPR